MFSDSDAASAPNSSSLQYTQFSAGCCGTSPGRNCSTFTSASSAVATSSITPRTRSLTTRSGEINHVRKQRQQSVSNSLSAMIQYELLPRQLRAPALPRGARVAVLKEQPRGGDQPQVPQQDQQPADLRDLDMRSARPAPVPEKPKD